MLRLPVRCSCGHSATFYVAADKKVRCRLCDQQKRGATAEQVDGMGYVRPIEDAAFERGLEPFVQRLRMALAEVGYPEAHVYAEATGVFIEGVPEDVQSQAVAVCDG